MNVKDLKQTSATLTLYVTTLMGHMSVDVSKVLKGMAETAQVSDYIYKWHHLKVNIWDDSFLHFKRLFIRRKVTVTKILTQNLACIACVQSLPSPQAVFGQVFSIRLPYSLGAWNRLNQALFVSLTEMFIPFNKLEATEWFFNTLIKQISQLASLMMYHTFLCFALFFG